MAIADAGMYCLTLALADRVALYSRGMKEPIGRALVTGSILPASGRAERPK